MLTMIAKTMNKHDVRDLTVLFGAQWARMNPNCAKIIFVPKPSR